MLALLLATNLDPSSIHFGRLAEGYLKQTSVGLAWLYPSCSRCRITAKEWQYVEVQVCIGSANSARSPARHRETTAERDFYGLPYLKDL